MISFAEQFGELDSCCFEWSKDSLNEVLMRQFGDFQHVDFSACQAVPVGEVTEVPARYWDGRTFDTMFEIASRSHHPSFTAAPTAKPSLSALNRVAGEKVRGIGWCDA